MSFAPILPQAPATRKAAVQHRPVTPIALCLLVVAASLIGCAAREPLPPPLPGLVLPSAWSNGDRNVPVTALDRWWQAFGDQLLDTLVQRALDANPRVQGADAMLRQARALRDLAAAGLQPLLGLSASAPRQQRRPQHGTPLSVGLDASWAPDLWGEQRRAVDAAEASRRSQLASLGDVQLQVAVEVSLNYLALRGLQSRLRVAQTTWPHSSRPCS
jgi:outer membrane protein TolC